MDPLKKMLSTMRARIAALPSLVLSAEQRIELSEAIDAAELTIAERDKWKASVEERLANLEGRSAHG